MWLDSDIKFVQFTVNLEHCNYTVLLDQKSQFWASSVLNHCIISVMLSYRSQI